MLSNGIRAAASLRLALLLTLLMCLPTSLFAVEVTVKNDSLADGGTGAIQAGFVAGESAAAWLASPCQGTIVAVQVFWRSTTGTAAQSVEDSIAIYTSGTFPAPNEPPHTLLEGPVMTDSVMNEFRWVDENQTIPISVPVNAGQVFVVSFKFFNTPNQSQGPSVVTDVNGCQSPKNSVFAQGFGWINPCVLGMSGDFVIRAVINCTSLPGACCVPNGTCVANQTLAQCQAQGGLFKGEGSTCGASTCNQACCFLPSTCQDRTVASCNSAGGFPQGLGTTCATTVCFPVGACCRPDGTCQNNVSPSYCESVEGTFQGNNSQCVNVSCPQPYGACCFSNGNCQEETADLCLGVPGAEWKGAFTTCADVDIDGFPDACQDYCAAEPHGDFNGDGLKNGRDIRGFVQQYVNPDLPGQGQFCRADFDENSVLTYNDVNMFVTCLLTGPCP